MLLIMQISAFHFDMVYKFMSGVTESWLLLTGCKPLSNQPLLAGTDAWKALRAVFPWHCAACSSTELTDLASWSYV